MEVEQQKSTFTLYIVPVLYLKINLFFPAASLAKLCSKVYESGAKGRRERGRGSRSSCGGGGGKEI